VGALLAEKLPQRVATALCAFVDDRLLRNHGGAHGSSQALSLAHTPVNVLHRSTRRHLIDALTRLTLPVVGTRGWNFAEVTAGGIPLKEINPATMASRIIPGLYVIGEILDCDGRIGGFNFQWAWSTGYIAGFHVSQSLEDTAKQSFRSGRFHCSFLYHFPLFIVTLT